MVVSPSLPRRGRRLARIALPGALLAFLLWSVGCVSTVTPPPPPAEPVEVYLIGSGRHAGLVLPAADGGHVEYAYGDWDWYARGRDRWYHVFATILWPTAGTLGQRRFGGPAPSSLRRAYGPDGVWAFAAERGRVVQLRATLEERFHRRLDEMIYNPLYDLRFVPADRGYWFLHTCHDESAAWLRFLGCTVSWVPIRSGLRLAARDA